MKSKRQLINISNNSFFESNIPINAPVQLEYGSHRWISTIRGSKFSKYILVATPESDDRMEEFERRKVFVRFLVEGIVYGYEACVMKEETKPPILVLEYPKSLYRFNLRKNRRVNTLHPICISVSEHSKVLNGALVDFSDKGALVAVETSVKLRYGQQLSISLTLSDKMKIKSLLCNVSNARLSGDKQLMGVSFDNSDKNKNALSLIKSFFEYCFNICVGRKIKVGKAQNQEQETFYVGQEITLELHKKPIRSFVRGCRIYRHEGYILCDFPEITDKKQVPKLGDVVIVNYKLKGKKCKTVMEFGPILHNTNLWMLMYLIEAIEYAFRKHERYESLIPAKITYKTGLKIEKIGEGLLDDISLNGARIITDKPLSLHSGNIINISFQLGDYGTIDYQNFKVIRKEYKNKIFEYSGNFINMKDKDQSKFNKFFEFCKEWKLE